MSNQTPTPLPQGPQLTSGRSIVASILVLVLAWQAVSLVTALIKGNPNCSSSSIPTSVPTSVPTNSPNSSGGSSTTQNPCNMIEITIPGGTTVKATGPVAFLALVVIVIAMIAIIKFGNVYLYWRYLSTQLFQPRAHQQWREYMLLRIWSKQYLMDISFDIRTIKGLFLTFQTHHSPNFIWFLC